MQIRASQKEDITAIMRIYEKARAFMDQTGNPTQWGDGYPQQDLIEEDLQQGHSYVCEENRRDFYFNFRGRSDLSDHREGCMAFSAAVRGDPQGRF